MEVNWCEIFEYIKARKIDTIKISVTVEYSMAMKETNFALENIFSSINFLWIDENNCFLVETVIAIIIVKTYFWNYSCIEFYNSLLKKN